MADHLSDSEAAEFIAKYRQVMADIRAKGLEKMVIVTDSEAPLPRQNAVRMTFPPNEPRGDIRR